MRATCWRFEILFTAIQDLIQRRTSTRDAAALSLGLHLPNGVSEDSDSAAGSVFESPTPPSDLEAAPPAVANGTGGLCTPLKVKPAAATRRLASVLHRANSDANIYRTRYDDDHVAQALRDGVLRGADINHYGSRTPWQGTLPCFNTSNSQVLYRRKLTNQLWSLYVDCTYSLKVKLMHCWYFVTSNRVHLACSNIVIVEWHIAFWTVWLGSM